MLVDGPWQETATFSIFHKTNGKPRYLQRISDLFRRHALRGGDVLCFSPLAPGRVAVGVHKSGSKVRPQFAPRRPRTALATATHGFAGRRGAAGQLLAVDGMTSAC